MLSSNQNKSVWKLSNIMYRNASKMAVTTIFSIALNSISTIGAWYIHFDIQKQKEKTKPKYQKRVLINVSTNLDRITLSFNYFIARLMQNTTNHPVLLICMLILFIGENLSQLCRLSAYFMAGLSKLFFPGNVLGTNCIWK